MADVKRPADRMYPMEGVEIWRNQKNRFMVFQLHYSADPKKKDEGYRERVKNSMPRRKYMQEYELHWDSFAGMPVYGDYNERVHGSKERLRPKIGLPLIRGWDFGLTPACVVAQYEDGVLYIIDEFVEVNMGAEKFCAKVLSELKIEYPEWWSQAEHWKDFIDPSGFAKKDTDMTSCAGVLIDAGIKPYPGPVPFSVRRQAVENFLVKFKKGEPCFRLDLSRCVVLNRGFKGGYRYSESLTEVESANPKPIKDEHSHPHDALQYVCWGVQNIVDRSRSLGKVPRPEYGFTGNRDQFGKDRGTTDVLKQPRGRTLRIGDFGYGKK